MNAERILVVDDEIGLCAVLTDPLTMEGYEVVACATAVTARYKLKNEAFDLAVLDVYLSDKPTGLEIAREIFDRYPDTGVILMTGCAGEDEIESACLSGAYACIAKPFNLDDVLRVIGQMLDGRRVA